MKDETKTGSTGTGAGRTGTARDLPQEALDAAHRIWLAGLGALASAQEGGDRLFRQLVDRGREMEGAGKETVRGAGERAKASAAGLREGARSAAEGMGDALDSRIGSVLHRLGVPTRDEIQDLTRRVEELNGKVERLRTTKPSAAPATSASRSAAAVPAAGVAPAGGAAKPGGAGGKRPAGAGSGSKPAGAGTGSTSTGGKPAAKRPAGGGKTGSGEGGA